MFEWQEKLSVSVHQMDQQHQELLRLMKALEDVPEGQTLEAVSSMEALIATTKKHFRAEEDLMAKKEYLELEDHKKIHRNLLKKMEEFDAQVRLGYTPSLKRHIVIFLEAWIIGHIKSIDKKYSKILV